MADEVVVVKGVLLDNTTRLTPAAPLDESSAVVTDFISRFSPTTSFSRMVTFFGIISIL